MPRSLSRPQVGTIVWYYAASPPGAAPLAAMVVNVPTPAGSGFGIPLPGAGPTLDLTVFAAAGTTSAVLGVPFYYGTRPASGAWCTMPRVNQNLAGAWPASQEAQDYELHNLNAEQREARIEQLKEAAEKAAKEAEDRKEEEPTTQPHDEEELEDVEEDTHPHGRGAPRRRR